MSEAAALWIKVGADISDLAKKLDTATNKLKNAFLPSMIGAELIADGIKSVASGIVDFAKGAIDHLAEVEQISAQTAAAIRSTGGAAGISAEEIAGLADAIESATGVSGEMIQQGENLLLTFTNVKNGVGAGNDIFSQTTQLMADMSVALGQDATSSAMQLGKALNDPIQGVSALQRVGVSFTESQKEQIKTLVESGKTMEAQKLILGELRKEFGGSAEAFGGTFKGSMEKASAALENLGDAIFGELMPALKLVLDNGARAFSALSSAINDKGLVAGLWSLFGPEMKAAIIGIGAVVTTLAVTALPGVAAAAIAAVAPFAPLAVAAAGIGAAAYVIIKNWDGLRSGFFRLLDGIRGMFVSFGDAARGVFDVLFKGLQTAMKPFLDAFRSVWAILPEQIKGPLAGFASAVTDKVASIPRAVVPAIKGMGSSVASSVSGMVTGVQGFMGQLTTHVKSGFGAAQVSAEKGMGGAAAATAKAGKAISAAAKQAADEVAKAFADLPAKLQGVTVKAELFGEQAEVNARQASELRSAIEGLIDKGLKPTDKRIQALVAQWKKHNDAAEKAKTKTFDLTGAMEDISKELKTVDLKAAAFGKSFNAGAEQTRVLEAALNKLVENGVSPASVEFQGLKTRLDGLKPPVGTFQAFQGSVTDVMTAASGLKEGLSTLATVFGVDLSTGMFKTFQDASNVAIALVQIGTGIGPVAEKLTTSFLPALAGVGQAAIAAIPSFATMATTVWTTVVPAFTSWAAATIAATWPILAIIAAVAAVGTALVLLYQNVEWFRDGVNAAWEAIKTTAIGAWEGLARGVTGAFGMVAGFIKGQINAVIGAVNFLIQSLNRIRFSVPSWVPAIGGMGWNGPNIPTIPYLAKGGLVSDPTLAMIGEGRDKEAVLPLNQGVFSQLAQGIVGAIPAPAYAGAGGGSISITLNYQGGGSRADAEAMAERIVGILRQRGIKA